ncbi:unnamed protein product, partial [Amoebophrya sp. A120]|eukprot:GSA120T00024355001.1
MGLLFSRTGTSAWPWRYLYSSPPSSFSSFTSTSFDREDLLRSISLLFTEGDETPRGRKISQGENRETSMDRLRERSPFRSFIPPQVDPRMTRTPPPGFEPPTSGIRSPFHFGPCVEIRSTCGKMRGRRPRGC